MIIQLSADTETFKALLSLLKGKSELAEVSGQLQAALSQSDDNQSDEVPQEGDNAKIARME